MVDEQYIAADVAAYPADRGTVLVSNQGTGRAEILDEQIFGILRQADQFDTLAGHLRKLSAAGWEDDGSGFIESAFQDLIARGLMLSKSAFLEGVLENAKGKETPPPVKSVAITTRDRLPQLQRCLGGFIQNNENHGRQVNYLVVDDSRMEKQGEKMRGILGPFTSQGAKVFYAGMEEKAGYARALVRAGSPEGLPADVVEFCLFGDGGDWPTYGTNRNAALLATAGELFVMCDDDIVYESVTHMEPDNSLTLTSLNDPTVLQFFADRAELTAAVHTADAGVLSCHEKLLGRSIPGCLSSIGSQSALQLGRVGVESARKLFRRPAVVRATMSGYWGDSGMGSPHAALEFLGESRRLAMRSKAEYAKATKSREVFRSVPQYTISDGSLFMTMNAGYDNRVLLPPFLPLGRNEDGLFSMTMRGCVEGALLGHIPLAVHHSPDGVRRFRPNAFLDPTPGLADTIAASMASFSPFSGVRSAADRLTALGRHLMDLGSLETNDFEDQLRTSWLAAAGHSIGSLEHLLDVHKRQPEYWADDMQSLIENLKDFIVHRSPAIPLELCGGQSVEEAKESCKRLVRKFGELLYWWPVIHGAAKRLRDAGTRLARPLYDLLHLHY